MVAENEFLLLQRKYKKIRVNMFSLDKRNIRVAISPFCNLNCAYCDGPKGRKKGKPGAMEDFRKKPLKYGIIKIDEFLKIIKS
jgi:MoaA/NifB/PqqE/SkfB family radical SAM enzyme